MGFCQNTDEWVILPKWVAIYSSDDGVNYQVIDTIFHNVPPDIRGAVRHDFECKPGNLHTRYFKVVAKYFGNLPEWHESYGNPSMLFADEIIIR